jgi:hypothetical protein
MARALTIISVGKASPRGRRVEIPDGGPAGALSRHSAERCEKLGLSLSTKRQAEQDVAPALQEPSDRVQAIDIADSHPLRRSTPQDIELVANTRSTRGDRLSGRP